MNILLYALLLNLALRGVQHHKDHVSRASDRNDLSTTTFALRSALDDTGQIEQLYLGALVLDHTRHTGQGRELVSSDFALGVGDRGKQSGLADGRKADEGDTGVAGLHDIEAFTLGARFTCGLKELGSVLDQLGLQQTQMVFGS